MPTSKRIEGDLPSGGAYALVYFRDADGSPVEEAEAVSLEIVEYSASGNPIAITTVNTQGDTDADDSA